MRLLFLAGAAILATGAGAAAPPPQPAGEMPVMNPNESARADCPPTSRYEAARRGGPLKATPLNQLHDADMYVAVYRHIGGCEVPIIAKYGVAGDASLRR